MKGGAPQPPVGSGRAFREGVLVQALNPKTAGLFLALIPQFVGPAAGSIALQLGVLGFVSVALNTLADVLVACIADSVQKGATARPNLIRSLRETSGIAMNALGIGVVLLKRPAI
jgi:threonine/homoserine/homoserine lactone efflux protein